LPNLSRYILKRLIQTVIIIIGISAITFFLARVAPSDPAALWVGIHARAEQIEKARIDLGLDKPLYVQYYIYMRDLIGGDWGTSYRTRMPVIDDILNYLPASMELAITGQIIAITVGIPLGVLAASRKDTKTDHASRVLAIAALSVPVFWIGILLQILFARTLGILPIEGRLDLSIAMTHPIQKITGFHLIDSLLTGNWIAFTDALRHIILPAIALASYSTGLSLRMTRSTMIEVLREKYLKTARAFGLPENQVRFKYALKNAIVPTLMVLGISFSWSLTGAFLVEVIFNWPGLGTYVWRAILAVDYPVIVGIAIIAALIVLLTNLILDLAQAWIDPRVRL
jgi:peptide/nickel transport system permease protein